MFQVHCITSMQNLGDVVLVPTGWDNFEPVVFSLQERQKLRLHRGPKHIYVHDKSFLKSLPQSNFCKVSMQIVVLRANQ